VTEVELELNGRPVRAWVAARVTLADFIRDHAHLTGTHLGCEHGVCGACTVLLDGAAVRSCLLFAGDGDLHPLQEAFRRHHALQCGYCTPGFLMALAELWPRRHEVTADELDATIAGQLCRCTGYAGIVAAARDAFGLEKDPPPIDGA
jgi:aerobic-type carbon monoxide dehydrogenase small subunit (CoxS/CutS family)